ncbi:MAG: HlyD family efflux transporter periplasmic adaptor subunit [Planctomycetota bacterium]
MTSIVSTAENAKALPLACQALIDRAGAATTVQDFLVSGLEIIGQRVDALYVRAQLTHGVEAFDEYWSDGTADPEFWEEMCERVLEDALVDGGNSIFVFRKRDASMQIAAISSLIEDEQGLAIGAVVAVVACSAKEIAERLGQLYVLSGVIGQSRYRIGQAPVATPDESTSNQPASSKAMRAAGQYESRYELAFGLVNQLKTKSGCDLVALGVVQRRRVEVLAISGFDEVKRRSPGIVHLRQAMEECVDHSELIYYQKEDDGWSEERRADFRLHRQWHEAAGGDCVATIPLVEEGDTRYVLALRRGRSRTFTGGELEKYSDLIQPYTPVLDIVEKANRSVTQHAAFAMGESAVRTVQPGHWVRKVSLIVGVLAMLWFVLGTRHYHMSVPAVVVPAEVRQISSPFDAVLREVAVVPGDLVEPGQLLCRFDVEKLELERKTLEGDVDRLHVELRKARADRDAVAVRLVEAQISSYRAQIDTTQFHIDSARVVAQEYGVVVGGDLRERVGDLLRTGEPLFEISTDGRVRLDLHVPESEVALITPGLAGQFTPFSRPDAAFNLEVQRIAATASQHSGRNVYAIEAAVPNQESWMRGGMEGMARVDAGPQPVWWITLHETIDTLRMKFWF